MGLEWLTEPFQAEFMQRALAEILLIAIPAGLLGTWVVTRRLAFATHAIGHATFPALVVAALAGWSLTATALVAAVGVALLLAGLERRTELRGGAGVAILLSTALAVGAVLVSDITDPGVRANALLFGSLLAISWTDVAVAALAAAAVIASTLAAGRAWATSTFEPDLARAEGTRTGAWDLVLLLLLAATIAVAVRAVGSLLVASLFLVPSATARLACARIVPLHLAGVAIAAAEGVAGLWIAYRLDAPPGAAIAALSAGVYVVALVAHAALGARRRQLAVIPT